MSAGPTAWLVNRYGKKVMYPAMLSAAAGLLLLASAGQGASYFPTICFAFLLLGVGGGASFMPLLQIGMSEIPKDDAGLGSGIVNVSQQMAAAVGPGHPQLDRHHAHPLAARRRPIRRSTP